MKKVPKGCKLSTWHCLRMRDTKRIDLSAMAHHRRKMDFCVTSGTVYTNTEPLTTLTSPVTRGDAEQDLRIT